MRRWHWPTMLTPRRTEAGARRRARREHGDIEQVEDERRDEWRLRWLESLRADLRYGWRSLRGSPVFTLVAVGSLAIGLGANTAIFSLADAALLRRLPVREAGRLVELIAVYPDGHRQTNLPAPVFGGVRRESAALADVFAQHSRTARLRIGREPSEPVDAVFVSGNYFSVLGTGASRGRLLGDDDDHPGSARAAVLSHRFWSNRLASHPDVVGQTVWVDGSATTIVGVAAPGFFGVDRSSSPQIFLPRCAEPPTVSSWIVARLHPGISIEAARARMAMAYRRSLMGMLDELRNWPERDREEFLAQRVELHEAGHGTAALRWQIAEPLRVLGAAVLVVLFIACTNVAALQLSRGERRIPEIALRVSIGASRGRILRQLLTESTMLAALGGIAGLGLGFALHSLLRSLLPLDPSATLDFRWDWRVFGLTLGVSTLAGLATGLVPARRLGRVEAHAVLKGAHAVEVWRAGPRRLILVAQVAGTVVLLAGAGLLLRSLDKLAGVEPGFDLRDVLAVRIDPSTSRFSSTPTARWSDPLAERLGALPGVLSTAVAANTVFTGRESWVLDAWIDGHEYGPGERHRVGVNRVGPGFFSTVGIPLQAGREFQAQDDATAPRVAIVNQALARRYFGDTNPIGRRLGTKREDSRQYEVVGVAADAKIGSLRESPWPAVYFAARQQESPGPAVLHLRMAAPLSAPAQAIRSEVARLDPDLEIRRIETLEEAVGRTLRKERMMATLLSLFAGATLFLTAVGLCGTVSYAAARRTGEIGIRTALGATRAGVVAWMLREAAAVVLAGAGIGLLLAAFALPSLRGLAFQIDCLDPASLGGAVLAATAMGLGAALLPAWRAAGMEPMAALRHE